MSKLARDNRNGDLARIHIAKQQLGMSQPDYEAMIKTVGRVQTGSSKDLDFAGRQRVLDHLRACGFKPKLQPTPPQGWQLKKIEDLWALLGKLDGVLNDPSNSGLQAFVQRMTNVSNPRFLDTRNGIKVVEALKAWLKRAKAK